MRSDERPSHLRDQVARLLDEAHQLVHIAAPLVQHLVARLRLDERDDARRTVDLGVDRLRGDEAGEELLGFGDGEGDKGSEAGEGNPGVVAGDDANVL